MITQMMDHGSGSQQPSHSLRAVAQSSPQHQPGRNHRSSVGRVNPLSPAKPRGTKKSTTAATSPARSPARDLRPLDHPKYKPKAGPLDDGARLPHSSLNKHAVLGGLESRSPEKATRVSTTSSTSDASAASAATMIASAANTPRESETSIGASSMQSMSSVESSGSRGHNNQSKPSNRYARSISATVERSLADATGHLTVEGTESVHSDPGILHSSSTMISVNSARSGGSMNSADSEDLLARSATLLNLSQQVEQVKLSERDRQRRNHQDVMATRQKKRELKLAEAVTRHTRGHGVIETKIESEKERQRKVMMEKLKKRQEASRQRGDS